MISKIIVADAGPLIAFGKVKKLSLLTRIGSIIAPSSVLDECLVDIRQPGANEIALAVEQKQIQRHPNPDMQKHQSLFNILGLGEATAIVLAENLNARLLIDDKAGRKISESMGIKIIGTAGILILAKQKKLIKAVSPLIQELKKSGYYFSEELIKTILSRVKED